jgi:hypothetical protein
MLRAMPAMAGISTCAAVRTSIRLLVDSESKSCRAAKQGLSMSRLRLYRYCRPR